jgi:hypothetical protein
VRGARAAPAGIHHQLGGQCFLGVGGATADHQPGDAAVVGGGDQAHRVGPVEDAHVGQRLHAAADLPLQQRAALGAPDDAALCVLLPQAVLVPAGLAQYIHRQPARSLEVVQQAGEQIGHQRGAPAQQAVGVAALRHALA